VKPKKVGDVFSIRAVCDTSLLVAPGKTEGEASISQGWFCPSCTFLYEMDGFLKIGTGLGVWWIEKSHWTCPEDEEVITPYVQEGDLRYLPDVPYFQHTEAARDNVRHSLVCTLSAVLIYLGIGNIESYEDYLEMLSKHGDGSFRADHRHAFIERGLTFAFSSSIGPLEVQDAIDAGIPAVLQVAYRGTQKTPYGFNYYVLIHGYSPTHWLCHDPCGRLDLVNGFWASESRESGESILYSRSEIENRLFRGGGASGVGWVNFKEN
jgi:hypothetical protein